MQRKDEITYIVNFVIKYNSFLSPRSYYIFRALEFILFLWENIGYKKIPKGNLVVILISSGLREKCI